MPFNKDKALAYIQAIDGLIGDPDPSYPRYGNKLGEGACFPKEVSSQKVSYMSSMFPSARPNDEEAARISDCYRRIASLIVLLGRRLSAKEDSAEDEQLAVYILQEIQLIVRQLPPNQKKWVQKFEDAHTAFVQDAGSVQVFNHVKQNIKNEFGKVYQNIEDNVGLKGESFLALLNKLSLLLPRVTKQRRAVTGQVPIGTSCVVSYYQEVPDLDEIKASVKLVFPEDPLGGHTSRINLYEEAMTKFNSIIAKINAIDTLLNGRQTVASQEEFDSNNNTPTIFFTMLGEALKHPGIEAMVKEMYRNEVYNEGVNATKQNRAQRPLAELIKDNIYLKKDCMILIDKIIVEAFKRANATPPTFPTSELTHVEKLRDDFLKARGFPDPANLKKQVEDIKNEMTQLMQLLKPVEKPKPEAAPPMPSKKI